MESSRPEREPRRNGRNGAATIAAIASAVTLSWLLGGGVPSAAGAAVPGRPSAGSWTVYHGDVAGSGVAPSVTGVDTTSRAWTSPVLDGQLYGEPLEADGLVVVATENDTVVALSTANGSVVWSTHIATPVPASALPCGDIRPTVGITGTPVIDTTRGEIFAVADEWVSGHPAHMLVGLALNTGRLELAEDVDPSGADPGALLQRTGLTLDNGQVVFGMGGNYGDCSAYRGRVVAVPEGGGTPALFTVDSAPSDNQGAIWMGGGAPAIDASGDIWVSAGNGSVTSNSLPYDDSDSLLELSPSLQLLQYFAPTNWPENNADDLDMSVEPALLGDGQVVLAGKSRIVYLLNGSDLGGIGGQQAEAESGCDDDIDGGTAVEGSTVYLPCLSGTIAVEATASPAALRVLWRSNAGGGPPIVAGGLVWTIGQDGTLFGLDPATGAVERTVSVGVPANHFPTPGVGTGLLLVPSARQVVALATTPPPPTPAGTGSTTSTRPRTTRRVPPAAATSSSGLAGGALAGVIAGAVVLVALVVAVSARFLRRRQGTGAGQGSAGASDPA